MSLIGETGSVVPEDWIATRLSNVADVFFSNVDKHTLENETTVRLCNYVDVYKNARITDQIDFMEASAGIGEIARFQIKMNDVLATKDSETPTDIAIPSLVTEDLPGVLCGYHLAMIRPRSDRVTGPFLYWLHESKQFRAHYECEAVGVTRFGLTQYSFQSVMLRLPSVPEQQRIVAYLDASCRAIDAAVAVKRDQIETLDRVRKANLQRVITSGLRTKPPITSTGSHWLSRVPAGWSLVMLKRVASVHGGLTLGKVYDGPLVERPYLRVANVQDGYFDLDDITMIEVPAEIAERVTLQIGDVLMTEGGDLDKLGRGHVWDGEIANCLHQNHVFAVRCVEWKLRPKFLAYVTASQLGRDYFEATGKRTTNLAATNSTKVGQLPVPLPPLDVQDKIIEYLDDLVEKSKMLRDGLEAQIATLATYRNSLIHECVTGQRRITDADLARVRSLA